jgi:hypothetical protein
MQAILSTAHFHNENAAYELVEARLRPNGPECRIAAPLRSGSVGCAAGPTVPASTSATPAGSP